MTPKESTKTKVLMCQPISETNETRPEWDWWRKTKELVAKPSTTVDFACLKKAYPNPTKFEQSYNGIQVALKAYEAEKNGYDAFKVLYDKFGLKGDLEVLHITEYLASLIKEGKLKPKKKVDITVTYHDPCHLGRMSEPYIHWKGKEIVTDIRVFDPPKEYRRGTHGVYEPPRDVLKSIRGLKVVEMDRIKEYAWCCGAGGGVNETNPEFSLWTANERIKEAEMTGAAAIVTACPWCIKNFNEAIAQKGSSLKVFDVIELLEKAL